MGLFDDKEDVLDIQLTQYGKKMLGLGKFMPKFYAFCDDDIIYDSEYASFDEAQNEAQDRILSNTARPKAQAVYSGVETEFKNDVAKLEPGQKFINEMQPEADKTYNSISVLGNSERNSNYRPAWKALFSAGEISSSYPAITGSAADLRVPQINLKEVLYDVNILRGLPSDLQDQLEVQNFESSVLDNEIEELDDGTIVEVVNQDIFLNLEELNSIFKNDNFEIEVFLVEEKRIPGTSAIETRESLKPLYFAQKTFIKDDIYDDEEYFREFGEDTIDPSKVEYYISVQVDDEIPRDVLCQYVEEDKRRGIYGKYLNCPDKNIVISRSGYVSDVDDTDLEENCD